MFLLPLNIMANAISTAGMDNSNKSGVSRLKHFQFLLSAFIGISGPGIVITTSTMCLRDILNILMVAYPQMIVLVFPILLELIVPQLKVYLNSLQRKVKDFEPSFTASSTASTRRHNCDSE